MSRNTTAGPGEIRSLRLKDCSLEPPEIIIPRSGAKNLKRERLVPLNDTAAWALEKLLDRAMKVCGCSEPEHYLFPFQNRDHSYEPTRAPSVQCWRTSLRTLMDLAGVKARNYDFRHHAVSRGLESPSISVQSATDYYGWISPKMIRRYSHASVAALREVAAAIDNKSREEPPRPVRRGDDSKRLRTKTGKLLIFRASGNGTTN